MKQSEIIKNDILQKVRQYYYATQDEKKEFITGIDKIYYAGRVWDDKELINLVDSSLEFWLTSGRYTKEFEKKFSEFIGVKYSYLVNSGSSANLLAFISLTSPSLNDRQIKRGDEIITTALCFPTTVTPILQYGAIPVFIDVDLDTANIDVTKIEKAITNKTKAIFIAHTLGNPFNIEKIRSICDKYNLWLIQDCCDALGSTYNNRQLATYGDISTFSFYPAHHITIGQGGMITTNCSILAKIIKSMSEWGRDCSCNSGQDNKCGKRFSGQYGTLPKNYDHKYVYSEIGMNLQVTDLQASIGVAQLEKLNKFILLRKANWVLLYEKLKHLNNKILFQKIEPNSDPSWFGFLMTIIDDNYNRNMFAQYLENNNIQTRNLFSGNITRQPLFNTLINNKDFKIIDTLDNTDKIMTNSLWIGVYPKIENSHIQYIVDKINKYFQ